MEKSTQPRPPGPGRRPGRGAKRDQVTREVTIRAEVPPGSRFKGYKTVVHRELVLTAEVVRLVRGGEPFVYAYYEGLDKVSHEYGLGEVYDE